MHSTAPKSSPQNISCQSGCIFLLEIIPPRHFLQIRMHSAAQNHPCKTFPANQDAFHRSKIIPAKHFLQIRMHSAAQNHPCQTFSANQDASPAGKSSPPRHPRQSGCILSMKSISGQEFCRIEMLLLRKANLWLTYSANQSSRILSHRDIAIVQKIHTLTFYLIKCQCMDIFVVLTSCDVNRHRRRSGWNPVSSADFYDTKLRLYASSSA